MNRIYYFFLTVCIIFASSGCTAEYPLHQDLTNNENILPKRSMDELINAVSEYCNKTEGGTRTNVLEVDETSIIPLSANRSRSTDEPLIYAINFKYNRGFAIASVSKMTPPILAIIDKGHYNAIENNNVPAFDNFLGLATDYVDSKDDIIETQDIPPLIPIDTTNYIMAQYTDTIKSTKLSGSRTNLEWGQLWPENLYCPNLIAGCVPVAWATLLAYFKPDMEIDLTFEGRPYDRLNVNWTEITKHTRSLNYWTVSEEVFANHAEECTADLSYHQQLGVLIRQLGVWGVAHYGAESTSAWPPGIRISTDPYLKDHKWTIVLENEKFHGLLEKEGIAVVWNDSHCWIVDGVGTIDYTINKYFIYNPRTHEYKDLKQEFQKAKYLRCCWGGGGIFDGYFLEEVFVYNNGTRANFPENTSGYVYK